MGGQSQTPIDVRILLRGALECKATKLAVMHNHPSGITRPSNYDKSLTRKLQEACKIIDIKLMDHIIIGISPDGQACYYSFHDNGIM